MTQVDEEEDEGGFSESNSIDNSSSLRSESSVDEKDKDGGNVKPGSFSPSPLAQYQDSEMASVSPKIVPPRSENKKKQSFEQASSDAFKNQNVNIKNSTTVSHSPKSL